MSYDLRIWERPVGQADPASFEEASRTLLELERLKPGPNPKFIALAEQMAARYPVLGQEQAGERDDNDSDAAWISDPVAGAKGCTSAVWAFELPTEDHVHVLRFVVERANELGLTVFDDQLGMVFISPDRVLPPGQAAIWEGVKREMDAAPVRWTLATARKAIKPRLKALLEAHGFVPVKLPPKSQGDAEFVRTTEAGSQRIYMFSRSIYSEPRFTVNITASSKRIADVLRAVFPEKGDDYANRQLSLTVGLFHGSYQGDIPVKSEADVRSILNMLEEPSLGILEMTRTEEGMERVMNDQALFPLPYTHPRTPKSFAEHCRAGGYAALVSAWLHGSDQFDEIAEYIRRLSEKAAPALKQENYRDLDRVLDYLRGHVKRGA